MNKEELLNLLHSEDFIAELNDADGIEGIQNVFKNKKINIDEKKAKIVMDALKIANEKMYNCESIEDNSLDDVSGGAETKIAKIILNSKLGGNSKYRDIIPIKTKLYQSSDNEEDTKDIIKFLK
ncbi:MAG: hypothetical protein Q4B84_00815 [Clostridia bacterium]|nr:hypothetical protein [Clostridia bacterium]